jgi:hypothetical protein
MRTGVIPKRLHDVVFGEQTLYGRALKSFSTPVNDAHGDEPGALGLDKILVDNGDDICRLKPMEVDAVLNWQVNRLVLSHDFT